MRRQEFLPFAPSPGTFVIGYVGRLVEQKGLRVLVQAAAGLPGDWRLLLVGDGPLRGELEQQASALGIADRLHIAPAVPSTEVPRWLNMCDCLVLPSLTRPNWKEQFGRVLVEAMACQVPVIGSDSGEIPHVIGEAGLVAGEGDADALRQRLLQLMGDEVLRRRLAELGRRRVLACYTQARIALATCSFYRSVLAGTG